MKKKYFVVEICPKLLNKWHKNQIFNQDVNITKTNVNMVTNKLSIFCIENHNCFCDPRVIKNPDIIKVVEGNETTNKR